MKFSVSPSILIIIFVYLVSGKSSILAVPLLAATLHEIGHLICARAFLIPIKRIKLNLFGALIETDPLGCSYFKEALLAVAGPLTNVVFALLTIAANALSAFRDPYPIQYFFVTSLSLAFINLLPIEGFDGGRVLNCILMQRFPAHIVYKILKYSSVAFVFLLWSFSIYLILKTGSSLLLFVFSGALLSRIFASNT